mgnify:CR=1 FL=1
MKILDLFSGVGGFSLGLEKAGMETAAFCEIDINAQKVLEKHWPNVPIFNDVKELTHERLIRDGIYPDIIVGGFPCQDISTAGKQAGIHGERSGLWTEFKRLIRDVQPKWAIIENVSALRSQGLTLVLQDLWEIGYDAEWHCIPASAVGAPHQRDRVWVIAYPMSKRLQQPLIHRQSIPFFTAEVKPRLSNDRLSEWLASWIRSRIVSGGDGIPRRLACHALSQYGNAVVPQIPELIGRAILAHEP